MVSRRIGRKKNAEARWLLPMICRRGGIDKHDIGAIRIMDTTNRVRDFQRGRRILRGQSPASRQGRQYPDRAGWADAPHGCRRLRKSCRTRLGTKAAIPIGPSSDDKSRERESAEATRQASRRKRVGIWQGGGFREEKALRRASPLTPASRSSPTRRPRNPRSERRQRRIGAAGCLRGPVKWPGATRPSGRWLGLRNRQSHPYLESIGMTHDPIKQTSWPNSRTLWPHVRKLRKTRCRYPPWPTGGI